jgi:hypothetical protein
MTNWSLMHYITMHRAICLYVPMTCFAIRHHDFLRDSNPLLVQSMFDNYKKVALNNLFCLHSENDALASITF